MQIGDLGIRGMDGKNDELDRVSNLPDFVLHRILSFLDRKEANQTCVLSKRWRFIWDTFPIFYFDQYAYLQNHRGWIPENIEKTREFLNFVDKSLQKFAQYKLSVERLFINLPLMERNYVPLVDQWVAFALDSGVQDLKLMVNTDTGDGKLKFINYTIRETTFAVKSMSDSFKLARLQKLSLRWVNICEAVIQNIVHNCPNLNYFCLMNPQGLKTLEISKLDKLETVEIISTGSMRDLQRVNIDAPNLKRLVFHPSARLHCSMNLTSCHDLKELCLRVCPVTDDLLQFYLSRFPLLEVLEIADCPMLRKVKISAQRLRSLQLRFRGTEIETIQIDAPTLSSFEYTTYHMPVLFSENVPCLMKIRYTACDRVLDGSLFSKLREFLGRSSQRKIITLVVRACEVNFNLEELGEEEIPPLIEIDHLDLELPAFLSGTSINCATLIDAVLWTCHPKILSILSNSIFQKDCIKVLCEKLLDRKQPTCCESSQVKCWRHHLKDAKIERFKIFEGIKGEVSLRPPNRLVDTWPPLESEEEVRFKFEWDF